MHHLLVHSDCSKVEVSLLEGRGIVIDVIYQKNTQFPVSVAEAMNDSKTHQYMYPGSHSVCTQRQPNHHLEVKSSMS